MTPLWATTVGTGISRQGHRCQRWFAPSKRACGKDEDGSAGLDVTLPRGPIQPRLRPPGTATSQHQNGSSRRDRGRPGGTDGHRWPREGHSPPPAEIGASSVGLEMHGATGMAFRTPPFPAPSRSLRCIGRPPASALPSTSQWDSGGERAPQTCLSLPFWAKARLKAARGLCFVLTKSSETSRKVAGPKGAAAPRLLALAWQGPAPACPGHRGAGAVPGH